MDLGLSGKVALVTGGNAGIGKAIALGLVEEGAKVAICARSSSTLKAAAEEIERATGQRILTLQADVSSREQVDAMVRSVVDTLGGLDILVNNAGIPGGMEKGPLQAVSDEGLLLDLNVKYVGYLRCARAAAPHMQAKGWGRIINIGGYGSLKASAYSTGARNIAVVHLSRILSLELAHDGVTSNVVHPGATLTERAEARWAERAAREGISVEEASRLEAAGNDLGRWIDAREVADVVLFVASTRSSGVTGESISAGGGARPAIFM